MSNPSDVVVRVLDTIIDVSDRLLMKNYIEELESEVTRLRDINEKFIRIINTLKNIEK